MATFVLCAYFSILAVLCVYGFHRLYITRLFHKCAREVSAPKERFKTLPLVTVQLPVFNEKFVVKRLIDATVALDYPRDLLEIQVLDDSTDETSTLAAALVRHYRSEGFRIHHLRREDRTGFKAGALAQGLKTASGEFITIFDADFLPPADILQRTIHYFTDAQVGMVQARWGHLNREENTLTQVQAIMLDAHFLIEHGGRCYANRYFNFNGTAGTWRRACIEEAGGWQHDTLTEDLDLSYRAQLKGWRFLFVPDVVCPAELPASTAAFKCQQHRWAKGSIQVMRKLLPTIWRSPIPLDVKIEATFHLTGNLAYILMLINSIFFVIPSMIIRQSTSWFVLLVDVPLFLLLSLSFVYFYLTSQYAVFASLKGRKRFIPALMAIGIGLGVNNTRAALEALFGKVSPFVRTPKTGADKRNAAVYALPKNLSSYLEILMGGLYFGAIIWAIQAGNWASVPILVLFQNGFLYIGWMTLADYHREKRPELLEESAEKVIA